MTSVFKHSKFIFGSFTSSLLSSSVFAALPSTIKLDYAYLCTTSLVVTDQKLLEKSSTKNNKLNGSLSQGSNRSLEYVNSGSVDFVFTCRTCSRDRAAPMVVQLKQCISKSAQMA